MPAVSWDIALKELLDAGSPEEWGRIVEARRSVLLDPNTLLAVKRTVADAQRSGSRMQGPLEVIDAFLRTARDRGVQSAVAAEKSRREEESQAIASFLSVPLDQTGQALRRHQRILLTAEAIRMAKRLSAALASQEDPADPMQPFRRNVRQLQLTFLEDAHLRGIDAAEQQYVNGLNAAIAAFDANFSE